MIAAEFVFAGSLFSNHPAGRSGGDTFRHYQTKCRRLAPFVSPKVAGRIVQEKGYSTYTFKPAYIKIKTRIDPSAKITRAAGEQIGGGATPITSSMDDAQIEANPADKTPSDG
jgi:hypothetical protein